jgi:hypothetical protein
MEMKWQTGLYSAHFEILPFAYELSDRKPSDQDDGRIHRHCCLDAAVSVLKK